MGVQKGESPVCVPREFSAWQEHHSKFDHMDLLMFSTLFSMFRSPNVFFMKINCKCDDKISVNIPRDWNSDCGDSKYGNNPTQRTDGKRSTVSTPRGTADLPQRKGIRTWKSLSTSHKTSGHYRNSALTLKRYLCAEKSVSQISTFSPHSEIGYHHKRRQRSGTQSLP